VLREVLVGLNVNCDVVKNVMISVPFDRVVFLDVVWLVSNVDTVKNAVTNTDVVATFVSYPVANIVVVFVWYEDVVVLDVPVANIVDLLVSNTVEEVTTVLREVEDDITVNVLNVLVVSNTVVVAVSNTIVVFSLVSNAVLNVT
jgi:hypothetical protein